ncbi:unnamed protein product [Linum trigynum]|uniref:Fungal lipase-type domain-containing protein n=1 Tax=Linum trigynum TaxID=586398 RepID=A0AAV2DRW4_9ROSI
MAGNSSSMSVEDDDALLLQSRRRRYLIVRPEKGGIWDLLGSTLWGGDALMSSACKFLETNDHIDHQGEVLEDWGDVYRTASSWVILVSVIARKIISTLGKPMEYTGYALDFFLNLLSLNGGISGLLLNFLLGKVVVPERGSATFISTIGHLDGRIDLYNKGSPAPDDHDQLVQLLGGQDSSGEPNRALMDLCVMASKLAYENAKVVQTIVSRHWKMHFVDFFNCWNDFQKQMSTQVFILCDKPRDAKLILISFRGTEPFDADDWCTDFDYSWYEIPKLGKVHMGFIEAMGLGNRNDISTLDHHLQSGGRFTTNHDQVNGGWQKSAYYLVKKKLKRLLAENKDAKFVVTGHSLGAALAILFPTVLLLHQEDELMKRLLGVYTFGQPRIGNAQLGKFMAAHLERPSHKYFRVVYCNDLVPRLPYDDKTFLYKHFGYCLYYDSFYIEQEMQEEPNKNFFSLRNAVAVHLNAVWELLRSLTIGYTNGPEYREGWLSMCLRVVGVALPGISAHSPINYVNSVRLGTTTQHACLY